MKTQISRQSHRPEKRYSGVYQQQGRMLTDSDWNELVEILSRRLDEALRDVVADGAPRERPAELVPAPSTGGGQTVRIQPGRIYADGVAAEVTAAGGGQDAFELSEQADLPGAPPPKGPCVVYADVWERPVTALMDPEETPSGSKPFRPHLRDPALHGADTTTRTQTMAQIKWAPAGTNPADPEDPLQNPAKGNAPVDLVLRSQREGKDECDPCADEVAIATRTGNYLFRLEVHDVEGDPGNPSRISLKWSSENGAEQHAVGSEPPELKTGAWVYEFFDGTTERHLGVHLTSAPSFPRRGHLVEKEAGKEYESIVPEDPWPWVRRWDGSCILKRTGNAWSLAAGTDRTVSLSTAGESSVHGHVRVDDGNVTLELQNLTLSIGLAGRTFVAGDFWLAAVREAIHNTGEVVIRDAPPIGITHHYLRLGELDESGNLIEPSTDERRRRSFPPLTDLRAGDVGYETGCTPDGAEPLFDASHDTVQEALDQICQLGAQNIGYDGQCDSGLFDGSQKTVKAALDRLCALAAEHVAYGGSCASGLFNGQATVRDALDRLCELAAEHVAYTPNPACEDLEDAATVQQAIDTLCLRPTGGGGGCKVTVGEDGQFRSLKGAIDALIAQGRRALCLCLLPGEHRLPEGLRVDQPDLHLTMTGCGPGTRLVIESDAVELIGLASVRLTDLAIDRTESRGLIMAGCRDVHLKRVELVGLASKNIPLLTIAVAGRIHVTESLFEIWSEDSLEIPREILGPARVGNWEIDLGRVFGHLNFERFNDEAEELCQDLAKENKKRRTGLAGVIDERFLVSLRERQITQSEGYAYQMLTDALRAETRDVNPDREAYAARLVSLLSAIRERSLEAHRRAAAPRAPAVFIADAFAETTIEDCRIVGWLQLYGGTTGEDLTEEQLEILASRLDQVRFTTVRPALLVKGNRLTSLIVGDQILQRLRNLDEDDPVELTYIFGTGQVSDNVFSAPGNQVVATLLNFTGNTFLPIGREGWTLAYTATFVGNQALSNNATLVNISRFGAEAANTLTIYEPK